MIKMVTQYFLTIQQKTQLFQSQYIEGIFIVKISWCSLGIITAICLSVGFWNMNIKSRTCKISTPSFSFGLLSSQLLFSWVRFEFLIIYMLYWFKLIKIKSVSKITQLWKKYYWGKLRLCEYLIGMNYCSLLKKKNTTCFIMQSCDFWYYKRIDFNVIFVSSFIFLFLAYLFHMFYLLSFGKLVVNQFTSWL